MKMSLDEALAVKAYGPPGFDKVERAIHCIAQKRIQSAIDTVRLRARAEFGREGEIKDHGE